MTNRRRVAVAASVLVLLVGVGAAGYWFRDLIPFFAQEEAPLAISPEAAASAETKLLRLRDQGDTVRLSDVELASLLRYRAPVWAAGMLNQPEIEMADDTVRISGLVATDRLPAHPQLDNLRALLPESSRVEVSGVLLPLARGRVAMNVAEVTFAGIPIPRRYVPGMLEQLGRTDEPSLPETALAVPLPEGVGSARVEHGLLVVTP